MSETGYLLANESAHAGTRFEALSALFDPVTLRHVEALGIQPGWRCWEVGAGGPSIPAALADRVGPSGHVLATDIDTSWAEAAARPGVEVRRHDVARDPVPDEAFDLVHARLVLVHVPERETALANMVRALKPGGWLLVEDADPALQPLACLEERTDAERLANRIRNGFRALMTGRGVDLAFGRKLPRLLRGAGLADIASDAFFPIAAPACAPLEKATVALLRDKLISAGLATAAELDAHFANIDAGRLDLTTAPMIAAWGRKP